MSVYLDIKLLYPHWKENWNMLMCKICIARRLVVDIFPWCNANFVPFPSGTLVARRMRNGRINWYKPQHYLRFKPINSFICITVWICINILNVLINNSFLFVLQKKKKKVTLFNHTDDRLVNTLLHCKIQHRYFYNSCLNSINRCNNWSTH